MESKKMESRCMVIYALRVDAFLKEPPKKERLITFYEFISLGIILFKWTEGLLG